MLVRLLCCRSAREAGRSALPKRGGDQETGSQLAARYGQKHPNKSVMIEHLFTQGRLRISKEIALNERESPMTSLGWLIFWKRPPLDLA